MSPRSRFDFRWVLAAAVGLASLAHGAPQTGAELYREGRVSEADRAYRADLERAQKAQEPRALWSALMARAWFEESTGAHGDALEHSNQALAIAMKLDDPFLRGRSLDWLGLSYASLGRYALAERFFVAALELGAPGGRVQIVPVWGLAQQELGALYFRLGDVTRAKLALEATYRYATEHGIDVGVAEGGAHLSEIAAHQGAGALALRLADEAVAAAKRCDCSQLNTARSLTARARALSLAASADRRLGVDALAAAREAKAFAAAAHNPRYEAEAALLLVNLLPPGEQPARLELASLALERLDQSSNELAGRAELQLAATYLDGAQPKLAELYLRHGIAVDEAIFRKVDLAFAAAQVARLDEALGRHDDKLSKFADAIDAAKAVQDRPALLSAQKELGRALTARGYLSLALSQLRDALATIEELGSLELTARQREALRSAEVEIKAEMATLQLRLRPGLIEP